MMPKNLFRMMTNKTATTEEFLKNLAPDMLKNAIKIGSLPKPRKGSSTRNTGSSVSSMFLFFMFLFVYFIFQYNEFVANCAPYIKSFNILSEHQWEKRILGLSQMGPCKSFLKDLSRKLFSKGGKRI